MFRIQLTSLLRQKVLSSIIGPRFYSDAVADDLRTRLLSEVKTAMKSKDTFTSTILRSVLSEVYAADKASPPKISSSAISSIIRKATVRRADSAAQFIKASRPDLAEKETREATVLSAFLPPLLSEPEVDCILKDILKEQKPEGDPRRALGMLFKAFFAKVDKSTVDTDLVKRRAEALLSNPN